MRGMVVQAAVAAVAVTLALATLCFLGGLGRLSQLVSAVHQLPSLRPPILAAATTLDLCAALLMGVLWTRLLARLGHRLPVRVGLIASLSSGLAGYLDNVVGSAAGTALTLRKHGVRPRRAALLTALAYMLQFCGILIWAPLGLLVVAQSHIGAALPVIGRASTPALASMVGGMIVSMPLLLRALATAPRAGNPVARRLLGEDDALGGPPLRLGQLLLLVPWSAAAWLCNALALLMVIGALNPVAAHRPFAVVGAAALASVLGALAFFVPEGLGVRDGVLLTLLAGAIHLSLGQATLAVVALRAVDTLSKLGLLLVLSIGGRLAGSLEGRGASGQVSARTARGADRHQAAAAPCDDTPEEAVA